MNCFDVGDLSRELCAMPSIQTVLDILYFPDKCVVRGCLEKLFLSVALINVTMQSNGLVKTIFFFIHFLNGENLFAERI